MIVDIILNVIGILTGFLIFALAVTVFTKLGERYEKWRKEAIEILDKKETHNTEET